MASGFLFWGIMITTLIYSLIPKFVKLTVHLIFYKEPPEVKSLKREILDLKSELVEINMVDEFAKYAKLSRKIRKCADDLAELTSQRNALKVRIRVIATAILHVIIGAYALFLLWQHRIEAVISVPPEWVYPLDKILSFPMDTPGALSSTVWLVISSSVTKTIMSSFK